MPDFFHLLSRYFWAIALAFSAFNYLKASKQFAASPGDQSTNDSDAQKYLKRFAIAAALPWIVMGVGQVTGVTPTVWHYFRPQDGNPFVLAWLGLGFLLACTYAWWVFFAEGASKVRSFNLMAVLGQSGSKSPSEVSIKAFAALGPLIFPLWVYLVVTQNVPLPK